MLEPPKTYYELDQQIRNQVLIDEAKGLFPDLSKLDGDQLEKIHRQRILNIVKSFINDCPINGDFLKLQNQLKDYAEKYFKDNYEYYAPKTIMNIMESHSQNAISNLIGNMPLNSFVVYIELLNLLYFYIQENYIRKSSSDEIVLAHNFVAYSIELLNSIEQMLLSGNMNSALVIYRTFYENYIVFAFLQKHPELQQDFIDHKKVTEYLLHIEVSNNAKQSQNNASTKKEYDELLEKYGDDFLENYGWTKQVIDRKQDRTLKKLYEESELGKDFERFYKLACKYTHSTAYSLFVRADFDDISNLLCGIGEIILKEFDVIFSHLKFTSKKEKELLSQWLCAITERFKKVFEDFSKNNDKNQEL